MTETKELVEISTRCKDCYYFKPDAKTNGFGYCFHFDEHVEFLLDELELDDGIVSLRLSDGVDAEAYREVSLDDYCSKGARR